MAEPPLLLVLDLAGTFVFGLNGALTAVRLARLDIVGILALGVITALGGGITRDVLIGAIPPAAFEDWRYLALALGGGVVAFVLSRRLDRLETPIVVLDAVGLSVFAVIGTAKALDFYLGLGPAILLGAITAVGGGTIRDTLVRQVPSVLHSDLYAIPALIAAGLTAAAVRLGIYGLPAALGAAAVCFAVRMVGVRFHLNAPGPPGIGHHRGDHDDRDRGGDDRGGSE
ncbi:trimeric intracellular cation channel family protein [Microbispora sp. H10836]|uniref:trimeric intracellular cation channel family protein n=1 Tax=Microbispora sp. H10836 TaxID=2729106 RepID=UPI001B8BDECC|nr:trimeric intracellular cation channel family protein [Microbispora sp. H10836]